MAFPVNPAGNAKHRLGDTDYTFANGMWYVADDRLSGVSYAYNQPGNDWNAPMNVDNSIMVQDRGIHIGDGRTRNNFIQRTPELNRLIDSDNTHGASIGWDCHNYDYVETYVQFKNISGSGGVLIVFQDVNNHDLAGNEVIGCTVIRGDRENHYADIQNSGGAGFHWFTDGSEPGWWNSAHIRLYNANDNSSYKLCSSISVGFHGQRKVVVWNTYTLKTRKKIRGMRFAGYSGAVNSYKGMSMGWRFN